MYMRKLLNRKSKMTIKVDYSESIIGNKKIYDDFIRNIVLNLSEEHKK